MNAPKLRFKEFNDEWKFDKISNLTTYVDYRGKTPTKTETGIFLVTAKNVKKGYIDYNCSKEYVETSQYNDVMHRGLPQIGDVLITTEAPCGNVAQINNINVALAQRIIKYRGKELINNTFLKYELLSDYFQKELRKVTSGGTVSGVKGSVLHQMNINYCSKDEQIKISNFLSLLDKKIELQTKKIEVLKLFKKGLIDKVIDNLTKYKEIQLGELGETYSGLSGKTKEDFEKGESHYIPFVAILNNKINTNLLPIVKIDKNEMQNEVRQYDLFFNTSSETLNEVGLCSTLNNDIKNTYLNSFCFGYRIRNLKEINNEYLNILLHSSIFRKKISVLGQGFTRVNISKNKLMEIKVLVPSYREQLKIVSIINMESNKLSFEENKLLKLQELKKGLMQSMFV